MTTDHLRAAMEQTRRDLARAVTEQNKWNFEVYRLQALLRNLAANLHEAEKAEAIQKDMQNRLAIGQAIEAVVNGADEPLAALEVMERLRFYNYDIDRYANPGAIVHQTLNRLAEAGRVKAYRNGKFSRNDLNEWVYG